MRLQPTSKQHEALFQELTGVLRKYDLSAVEILAVVSNLTGKVTVALGPLWIPGTAKPSEREA